VYRAEGYAIVTGPEGSVEMDTYTCGHCNGVVHEVPKQRTAAVVSTGIVRLPDQQGKKCMICQRRICRSCEKRQALTRRCVTYERKVEALEKHVVADQQRSALFRELEIE
jgi:hypothetical protein